MSRASNYLVLLPCDDACYRAPFSPLYLLLQLLGSAGWVNSSADLSPHPDYFTALLYKTLVGRRALRVTRVTGDAAAIKAASFHVWCAAATGGIALIFTNPSGDDVAVDISGVGVTAPRIEYTLTSSSAGYYDSLGRVGGGVPLTSTPFAPPASMSSDTAYLNGDALVVGEDGVLPMWPIPGKSVPAPTAAFVAPPYSYGIVVYLMGGSEAPAACTASVH